MAFDLTAEWRKLATDMVLLEGFHAIKHAIRFGAELGLLISTDRSDLLALAASHAPDLVERFAAGALEVGRDTFDRLVGRNHHTGTAALARRPDESLPTRRESPAVLLDQPRSLGNLGAVIRVAAGMGAAAVFTTGEADPWHPTAIRGSAGLHYALPVRRLANPARLAGPILCLDAEGEDIRAVSIPDHAVLAFGSERHGLSTPVRDRADRLLALPMRPGVSSYNLATSVGMALYHWAAGRG